LGRLRPGMSSPRESFGWPAMSRAVHSSAAIAWWIAPERSARGGARYPAKLPGSRRPPLSGLSLPGSPPPVWWRPERSRRRGTRCLSRSAASRCPSHERSG
jgi:hypothetical protein